MFDCLVDVDILISAVDSKVAALDYQCLTISAKALDAFVYLVISSKHRQGIDAIGLRIEPTLKPA